MLKRAILVMAAVIMMPIAVVVATSGAASADPSTSVVVYDATTNPLVPMPSEAFEATSTSEFGNEVTFATAQRVLTGATVTMDSWGCQSGGWAHPANDCVTTPGTTFPEPITLNIYQVGSGNTVGPLISSTTQTFNIPYRPSDTPSCSSPSNGEFLASDGKCAHGLPVNVSFNLGAVTVPDSVIYGISYNTSGYGPAPYGYATACAQTSAGCGYDSLNVGLSSIQSPSVGSDPLPGSDFLDSTWNGAYCDNGANGTGMFRWDSVTQVTGGSPSDLGCVANTDSAAGGPDPSNNNDYYVPAVQFVAEAAPTVSAITPNSGSTTGGTAVTITGANFTGASAVSFGGSAASSFTVVSATQVTATSPPGPAGPVAVSVTGLGGTGTLNGAFTYLCATPQITSAPTATAVAGSPFSFTVTTCAATVPVIKGAALPVGLRLVDNGNGTATISGTPSARAAGPYAATITASVKSQPTATQTLTVTVDHAPVVRSAARYTLHTGVPFSVAIATPGSYPVPTITSTSVLPAGVTLTDNGMAVLGGTPGPTAGGTYAVVLTASNGVGPPVQHALTLRVYQAPVITSAASDTVTAGAPMAPFTVTDTGYPLPAIRPGLPYGLRLTDNHNGTGTLSGTPRVPAGTYTVTIIASSVAGTAQQAFTVTVAP